jgi:hypothetical protein
LVCGLLACLVAAQLGPAGTQPALASPTLVLSPSSAVPGATVQATGAAFLPLEAVTISIGQTGGTPVAQASANRLGGFSTTFSVPSPSAYVQYGANTVWATGSQSGEYASATLTILGGQSQPGTGGSSTVPSQQMPSACITPAAYASPLSVVQGGRVSFTANGFMPSSQVSIQVMGPAPTPPGTATADSSCTVSAAFDIGLTDPPGTYTIQANGTQATVYLPSLVAPPASKPLQLSATFTVLPLPVTATPIVPITPTVLPVNCPLPQAFISSTALNPGQTASFGASGFRPGSFAQAQFTGPGGAFADRYFSPRDLGPAALNCSLASVLVVDPSTPIGHYRASITGPNGTGQLVTAVVEFDVVATGGPPVVLPIPTLELPPPGPGPVGPPPASNGQPAPVLVDQTIAWAGGARIPAVGQRSDYEHVIRIRNTSAGVLDLHLVAGGNRFVLGAPGLGLLAQGQVLGGSITTEYSPDSVILSSTASTGQATIRGGSVVWDGQLAAGQSLELRTVVAQTPTTALALTEPIRGQTINFVDQRGSSFIVPPVARPALPPAQRLVQPAPPPVDPVTGPRLFPDTGFAVADDNMWVYFNRRGGQRTFGNPISRVFTLFGVRSQLFEKGMLQVDDNGNVSVANLLEAPFLPYDSLGDLALPPVDDGLIQTAPDPSQPGFGDLSQEFVRAFAAESFENIPTRFYSTFLSTVLFRDAFFDGNGDAGLVPGFSLEIWGVPTSGPAFQALSPDEIDPLVVLQRFQRGVMRRDQRTGTTAGVPLGAYVRSIFMADALMGDVAGDSPLWGQYNPDAVDWIDRPDEVPDTNLVLAFEPDAS